MVLSTEIMDLDNRPFYRWGVYNPDLSGPPDHDTEYVRRWSNDLITSRNNRQSMVIANRVHIGGPFYCIKRSYREFSTLGRDPLYFGTTSNPMTHTIFGNYFTIPSAYEPFVTSASFPGLTKTSSIVLGGLGAEAVAETFPNEPEFDGSVAAGELLREGLPSLIGLQSIRSRALRAKNAGSEYLNVEFGWKPLVRDVRNFARALETDVIRLEQMLKRANAPLKREKRWPITWETETVDQGSRFAHPGMSVRHYSAGHREKITTFRQERWFKGVYTFHIDEAAVLAANLGGWLARARMLYGIELTPSVLWNLSPWSWLADWFANIGDVLKNISSFLTNSVSFRGYIMEHQMLSTLYVLRGVTFASYPGKHRLEQEYVVETKCRQEVDPFAPGLKGGGLSNRQKGILGALVVSRR